MYCWVYVDFYQNDGDAFMTAPEVFRTKKAAMEMFKKRVKKVMEEEIGEIDEITNRIEKPGYLQQTQHYQKMFASTVFSAFQSITR